MITIEAEKINVQPMCPKCGKKTVQYETNTIEIDHTKDKGTMGSDITMLDRSKYNISVTVDIPISMETSSVRISKYICISCGNKIEVKQ